MLRRLAQVGFALAAFTLLAACWRCDAAWFDRHVFLPQQFFLRAPAGIVPGFRALAGGAGALLLVLVPFVPRGAAGRRLAMALLLAVPAAEIALRWRMRHLVRPELIAAMDALTASHPRYGVTFKPSLDRLQLLSGRQIRFRTDSEGRRFSGERLDPALPNVVFTGESAMAGFGLQWEETLPALVAAHLHAQVVNLASPAYRLEQSLLRLEDALPKLGRPVAVVGIFMPGLLGRSLAPERKAGVLAGSGFYRLWRHLYWSDGAIDEGMRRLSASLRAISALARARGARCLFVVTGWTPQWMLHSLFESADLEFITVDVPPAELLADGHPNPQGSLRIADAVERTLQAATAER